MFIVAWTGGFGNEQPSFRAVKTRSEAAIVWTNLKKESRAGDWLHILKIDGTDIDVVQEEQIARE